MKGIGKPKVRLTVEAVARTLDEYVDFDAFVQRLRNCGHQILAVNRESGTVTLFMKEADSGK